MLAPMRNYRIIPLEERGKFKPSWKGFDLTGMKAGDRFLGCFRCGVQCEANAIGFSQCPNCQNTMALHRVEKSDLQ